MSGVTFDAGGLVAFERNRRAVVALVARIEERGEQIAVPAAVLAQVWRDGRRQVRLARLVGSPVVQVVVLDDRGARAAGQLCGRAGTADVVDATVVLSARDRGHAVVTSDPRDLRLLDADLRLVPA